MGLLLLSSRSPPRERSANAAMPPPARTQRFLRNCGHQSPPHYQLPAGLGYCALAGSHTARSVELPSGSLQVQLESHTLATALSPLNNRRHGSVFQSRSRPSATLLKQQPCWLLRGLFTERCMDTVSHTTTDTQASICPTCSKAGHT